MAVSTNTALGVDVCKRTGSYLGQSCWSGTGYRCCRKGFTIDDAYFPEAGEDFCCDDMAVRVVVVKRMLISRNEIMALIPPAKEVNTKP